jgi:hypothetical protein
MLRREEMLLLPLDLQFLLRFLVHLLDGGTLISRPGRLCPRRRRSVTRQGGLSWKLLRRPSGGGLGLRGVIGQCDPGVEAQTGQGYSSGSNKFHRVPPMTRRRQCCRPFPLNARVGRLCLVTSEFRGPRLGASRFRSTPITGHRQLDRSRPKSASSGSRDFVGERQQCLGNGNAERLRRFEIDHEGNLTRLLDRDVAGPAASKDFRDGCAHWRKPSTRSLEWVISSPERHLVQSPLIRQNGCPNYMNFRML